MSLQERLARIERLLEGYSKWLSLGFSPRTANTYLSVVRNYLAFYGDVPPILEPMEEVEVAIEFIEKYGSSLRSKQVAAYAIKSLYEYLGRPDIASRIPSPRGTGWTPETIPVDYETLRKLIEFMPKPRDRAMLCVAYELALRRSEVTLLKRSEFNPSTCQLIVYRLKRPKGVPSMESPMKLSPWCCRLLKEYLATRRDDCDCLFASETREGVRPVSRELVRRTFKKLASMLGLEDLRFHQLRHTRITELAERTPDVIALAKFAGHRNPQSTMIYIHLGAVKAQERLRGARRGEHGP